MRPQARRALLLGQAAMLATAAGMVPAAHVGAAVPAIAPGPVYDLLGSSVALSGATAVIGATGVNNRAGAAYVFARSGSRWSLRMVLADPRDVPFDWFGTSVAISGTTLVVGADGVRSGAGEAYVYGRSGPRWRRLAALAAPRLRAGDHFGESVAMTADAVIVGAPGRASVYVYARSGSRWRLRQVLSDPRGSVNDGFGESVALTDATAVVGAPGTAASGGTAYVYTRSGPNWRRRAALTGSSHVSGGDFGASVAVSDETLMVGSPGVNNDAGAAYLYLRRSTGWRQDAHLTAPGAAFDGRFGTSVAVAGTTAVVGAFGVNDASGAAYIYIRTAAGWQRRATHADPDRVVEDGFGSAVAVAGKTALISAPAAKTGAGAVYGFVNSGGSWPRRFALTDPRGDHGSFNGASVAISGTTAIVGGWGAQSQAGAAVVYAESHGRWHKQATLPDPDHHFGDLFGASVAVSGSTAVVGAWQANFLVGRAYVFVRQRGAWRLQATINPPSFMIPTYFGSSVAISGNTIVIGADGFETYMGVAYVYLRTGARWKMQATLPNPHNTIYDNFGEAVALSDSTILIGADGARDNAGAAFIFARSGTRWRRQATLVDPDARPNDSFGTSVALSGGTAVVGAPGDHQYAGAAYIYTRSGTRWHRRARLAVPRGASFAGGFGGAVGVSGTGRDAEILISGLSISGLATGTRQCGSAFEFTQVAARWHERARVADPRCRSYDLFGYAVAISGRTALIGAPGAGNNAGTAYLLTLLGQQKG